MKLFITILSLAALLAFAGCTTTNTNPMSHAAFTAAVTLGEQFALETHPEATPYVRAAVPVVCAVANGTNANSSAIVAALNAAGVTNRTAVLIINSSIALYNVVSASLGTNQNEIRAYGKDLCNGMTAGLPSPGLEARRLRGGTPSQLSSPHLR